MSPELWLVIVSTCILLALQYASGDLDDDGDDWL